MHRRFFVDYALSSLLASKNIPALDNVHDGNELVIATTREDWDKIAEEPLFELAKKFIRPVLIEIQSPEDSANKMLSMSVGHKALTDYAFESGAYGVHLCPDVIYSNGTMSAVQKNALYGKRVVLTAAVRFELEGVNDTMKQRGYFDGEPIELDAREAVDIALKHPHGEFKSARWSSPFFWDLPVYTVWDVRGENGVIQHTYSWSPILVDYASLDRHFTEIFETWTLDGDYIFKNFPNLDADLHVVTDSDEIFLLPVTGRNEASPPQSPHWTKSAPILGFFTRAYLLNMVHNHEVMDPLKRRIYFYPVRWHSKPLNRKWDRYSRSILRQLRISILSPEAMEQRKKSIEKFGWGISKLPQPVRHFAERLYVEFPAYIFHIPIFMLRNFMYRPIRLVNYATSYTKVLVLALTGDKEEIDRIIRRFKWLGDKIKR